MGLNKTLLASIIAGMREYTLQTPTLIESFDSLTGWSAPSSGSIALDTTNEVQGTGALTLRGNGVSGSSPITTKTLGASISPGNLGVVARYVYNMLPRITSGMTIQFGNGGGTFNANTAGVNQLSLGSGTSPGGYWTSFHESEDAAIAANGTITQIRVRTGTQNAPYYTNASTDALYSNAKGRPTVVIGFDDGEDTTVEFALAYMNVAGFVGTVYLPVSNMGTSSRMSWAEVRTLRDAGWAICLDGTPDDTSMTAKADVATAVTDFLSQHATLAAEGCDSDGKWFLCYPNGESCTLPTPTQVAAMTSDGSTTVTFGAASNVTNGMSCFGVGVPDGTTVVSGGGASTSSVVLSNAVAAQTKAAMFIDETGEFYFGRLPTALAAAGVKSARITGGGSYYTRFGFGTRAMETLGQGFSAMTLNQAKAIIDKVLLRGETIEFYIHKITADVGGWDADTANVSINVYQSFFTGLLDYLKTYSDLNQLDVLTKPQLYYRDVNAAAPT